MKSLNIFLLKSVFTCLLLASCQGNFLDIKSDSSLGIPTRLSDFEALLDNSTVMNGMTPVMLGEIGADNYFVGADQWQLLSSAIQKNAYIWSDDVYEGNTLDEWNDAYTKILYCNTVLDGISKISENTSNKEQLRTVKGTVLFFRAYTFYLLSQDFSEPFESATARNKLGVPLKLTGDINEPTIRPSLYEVYNQITKDLNLCVQLLPNNPLVLQRPSKAACHFLLARVFLQMGDYQMALNHSELCLQMNGDLTDYALIDTTLRYPFPADVKLNKEILFHSFLSTITILNPSRMQVAPDLLALYSKDDFRRGAFYFDNNNIRTFKGSYNGSNFTFAGFTTPEMYLVSAECFARLGNQDNAYAKLRHLRRFRVKNAADMDVFPDILSEILDERRRELAFRGMRWADLRRLNAEPRFARTIARTIDGRLYQLGPNDLKYTWPIPDDVINLSEIQQNER